MAKDCTATKTDFQEVGEEDKGEENKNENPQGYETDTSLKPQVRYFLWYSGWKYFLNPSSWNFALPNLWILLKWLFWLKNDSALPSKETLDEVLPIHQWKSEEISQLIDIPKSGLRVLWIGHASLLVQFDGMSILTDPVFSDYAAPYNLPGYKRYRPAGITIDQLPKIDAVVISHNHYDHLDHKSVVELNKKYEAGKKDDDKDLAWFVPLGLKSWFHENGCKIIHELDWWEECKFSGATFYFTPAQHWSIRNGLDRYTSLWGSWVIKGPTVSFFFAGDTGYNDKLFKRIGEKFGPFNLAAIPIGAYEPREVMRCQHINPEEAVVIHKEVRAKRSVGIHWGTFRLSNEAYDAPREELSKHAKAAGLTVDKFFTMKHGEMKLIPLESTTVK